jgi:hypothetical protein
MKYFLDTEFLEGQQKMCGKLTKPTIDLISIGIVCEDGREYYAISKDFNLKEAWNRWQQRTGQGDRNNTEPREYWLRDNVLRKIYFQLLQLYSSDLSRKTQLNVRVKEKSGIELFTYRNMKWLLNKYGSSNKEIASDIIIFMDVDVSVEYWVAKPQFYAYYADYDWVVFCWLFGSMMDLPKGFPMYCRDLKQMLDEKAPTQYALDSAKTHVDYPKQTNEHDALADARWNKELYKFLNKIR